MSVRSKLAAFVLISLFIIMGGETYAQSGGIGFQARLYMRSRVVTEYAPGENRFSAAIRPMSTEVLSARLLRSPKATGSVSWENRSFNLETQLNREVSLVPVSVSGVNYYQQRTQSLLRREWNDFAINTVRDVQQTGRREGLSIGISELPKRFEKMFGEGGANLRVTGYRRITFSGRSQWDDAAQSGIRQQSKFPSLNMEQISRFTIQGTIGSKITVSVSQDNQTDIPLANRLILRYKGDEDDVLQAIEAGNTTLSIPNTRFVGYTQRIQGLFGLKTEAQLGNLRFTAIASQEKGSSENAVVSATGEENADYLRDYGYVEGRIFDLSSAGEIQPGDSVDVWVYEEELQTKNAEAEEVVLDAGPRDNGLTKTWRRSGIRMKEVTQDQWELLYGQSSDYCPIALVFYSARRYAVGVRMNINHVDGTTTEIGYVGTGPDTLRIIQPQSVDLVPDHPAWDLMWRNCYRIPKNIKSEDIEIKIKKGLKGLENKTSNLDYQVLNNVAQHPYIRILGLDQWNNNGTDSRIPDNIVDNRDEVFRSDWGLIIFPEREPFNSSRAFESISSGGQATNSDTLVEKTPKIYRYNSDTEKLEASKYYLQLATKTRSATIRLGRANVIEGSERVTLNGTVLTKGTDYNVQYEMGQVTLLTPDALDPNADVQVEFQYAPFMTLQKKTLLGTRLEYERSKDFKIGTTLLYKSDKAQERKPRVGQETAEAMVLDADVSFSLHPNFLTKLVDAIPLVNTQAASLLRVSAEIAQSRPNPNVEGEAYVDDFESAVELLSLSNIRTRWTLSSEPLPLTNSADLWSRGTIRWHNPPAINREDVYKGKTVAGAGALQPLRLIFRPIGQQFIDVDGVKCADVVETKSWGGIMRSFGGIDEQRVQVFEVRAMGGRGILHFDFGEISEDINGNGLSEDEDTTYVKNGLDYDLKNGINEDTGLDGIQDTVEIDACDVPWDAADNPDPAHDNWWYEGYGKGVGPEKGSRPPIPYAIWNDPDFQSKVNDVNHWLHYEWQNGTEGNVDDQAVQGNPDRESLGQQNSFRQSNVYFTFELPLSTAPTNEYLVPESERNGWYTYRVPVRDPGIIDTVSESADRTPNWSKVDQVRVWFEKDTLGVDSLASMDSVWIADWGFVQSSWHDTLMLADPFDEQSKFYVASVSEDDGFTPPPGVEAFVDKVNNIAETQRGLSLKFTNLAHGAEGIAQKDLLRAESYSGYRRMQMYVHGDANVSEADSLMFYFRIGLDSVNYYEYRTQLDSGWAESNYVDIVFDEITALKDAADKALDKRSDLLEDSTDVYRVVGRPNINEIIFISASVVNHGSEPITGSVWIDELRVSEVRKDIGVAARVEVAGSLADLFSYQFNYEHRDAFFRGLSEATRGGSSNNLGSGKETNTMGASGTFRMSKLLPRSWGVTLPVTVGYSESQTIPILRTNSDVVLPAEVRDQEKSVSKSIKFSVSESFNKKGSNPLFSFFLNRQSVSFSYNRSRRKSVTNPLIFAENYNVRAEMSTGITKPPEVPVFFWTKSVPLLKKIAGSRLSAFPHQWRWSGTFNRSLNFKDDVDLNRTSSFSRTFDGRMDMAYRPFPSMSFDFSMGTKRDLTDPDLVRISFKNPKIGLENNYNQGFRASYDPKLLSFLTGAATYSANYTDAYDRSSESRSTSLTRNWAVTGEFRHLALLGTGRKGNAPAAVSQPGRGTVRGGVRAEDEKEKGKGDPFYEPVLKGLRFLTGWLSAVRYKYSEGFTRSIPGVAHKLPMKYRLGLDINADFPSVNSTRNPSAGKQVSYDLASGFTMFSGLTASVAYKVGKSHSLMSVGSDRTESITTSWPELSISIRRFKNLPLIENYVNWFIDIFSPKTGYSRQTMETVNLDRGFSTNKTESISRSPLISLNLKLFRRLSLSGSYTLNKTREEKYDRVSGALDLVSRSDKKTVGVTTKYAFNSPTGIKIPLFGKIKFKSLVSIDLTVQYSSNLVESSKQGGAFVPFTNTSSFSVSPVIAYSFSTQVRGGITMRWQDNDDQMSHRKSHVREVQLWTEIRF